MAAASACACTRTVAASSRDVDDDGCSGGPEDVDEEGGEEDARDIVEDLS